MNSRNALVKDGDVFQRNKYLLFIKFPKPGRCRTKGEALDAQEHSPPRPTNTSRPYLKR